eukprot:515612_1
MNPQNKPQKQRRKRGGKNRLNKRLDNFVQVPLPQGSNKGWPKPTTDQHQQHSRRQPNDNSIHIQKQFVTGPQDENVITDTPHPKQQTQTQTQPQTNAANTNAPLHLSEDQSRFTDDINIETHHNYVRNFDKLLKNHSDDMLCDLNENIEMSMNQFPTDTKQLDIFHSFVKKFIFIERLNRQTRYYFKMVITHISLNVDIINTFVNKNSHIALDGSADTDDVKIAYSGIDEDVDEFDIRILLKAYNKSVKSKFGLYLTNAQNKCASFHCGDNRYLEFRIYVDDNYDALYKIIDLSQSVLRINKQIEMLRKAVDSSDATFKQNPVVIKWENNMDRRTKDKTIIINPLAHDLEYILFALGRNCKFGIVWYPPVTLYALNLVATSRDDKRSRQKKAIMLSEYMGKTVELEHIDFTASKVIDRKNNLCKPSCAVNFLYFGSMSEDRLQDLQEENKTNMITGGIKVFLSRFRRILVHGHMYERLPLNNRFSGDNARLNEPSELVYNKGNVFVSEDPVKLIRDRNLCTHVDINPWPNTDVLRVKAKIKKMHNWSAIAHIVTNQNALEKKVSLYHSSNPHLNWFKMNVNDTISMTLGFSSNHRGKDGALYDIFVGTNVRVIESVLPKTIDEIEQLRSVDLRWVDDYHNKHVDSYYDLLCNNSETNTCNDDEKLNHLNDTKSIKSHGSFSDINTGHMNPYQRRQALQKQQRSQTGRNQRDMGKPLPPKNRFMNATPYEKRMTNQRVFTRANPTQNKDTNRLSRDNANNAHLWMENRMAHSNSRGSGMLSHHLKSQSLPVSHHSAPVSHHHLNSSETVHPLKAFAPDGFTKKKK